ncbi:hypothetical protein FIBSPDRAFT_871341 [Athelia psychrophila]|uniref:DUF5648 domain-containing protein n=1 Tax=Athelia psychrophila TaxID=1759441 RepID=A0A166AAG3_9AGAM|nr:hypothetical protein FIBSPDRAFT_871341 [Fibularhizoctonia sp. CBS 109695]
MAQMNFDTVGGIPDETDLVKWAESVNSFRNWRVTKKLAVRSVVTLFDKDTQAKILATQPADPAADAVTLFRLWNGKDHFYTASEAENNSVAAGPGYHSEPNAARIFSSQKAGTVPLFRLYCHVSGDHLYTTSNGERNALIANGEWNDEGQAGFVYADQASGTVPLYRLCSGGGDHFYTTDEVEHVAAVTDCHYTLEGISCYVYKA